MRPNKDRRTEIILYGLLLIPLLFAAAALAQATEQAQGLAEITAVLSEILHTPSMLRWCASTPKFLLAVLMLYPLAVYCYMLDQADRHPGAEHGTAKWGSAHRLNIKYRNTKDPKENYILTENVRFSTDSHAHKHNLNIIVIGGSGSGKTRFYVKPNALQLIGSYLFLDPKGELTRTLGRIMETKGISVTVLDLVHFQGHYNPMAYLETDEDAIKLAFAIVNNTKPKDTPSGGDKFWDDSSVLLISALILYLMYEAPASEQNFSTLMYMILNCQVSENEMVENPLMMLFGELERRDPQHPAVLQFKSFMLGAKKTLQSILISAAANLYMFNSRKFAEMTSRDEMFLPCMGLEQRALFIVLPDNDTTFNFIATMLYTQLFDQLFRLADSTPQYNGALPIHVRLMMDEFANVALPKNFKNILAVCRSRNISCDIILQNIAQLKSLFKDDWEGIIGNCDTLLYLGGNEYGTYEYLSKILGKETERTKSQSIGKGSRGSSSDSLQTAGRELCMPDEIRRMRDDECLLLMRSEDPVIDKKYNLLHHPNVKYTPDAGGEPWASYWPEVLAVFAVQNNLNNDGDVIVIDEGKKRLIQDTFWAMHEISAEVEEVTATPEPTEDEPDPEPVTEYILHITVSSKSVDALADLYRFTQDQRDILHQLLSEEMRPSLLALCGGIAAADGALCWPLPGHTYISCHFGETISNRLS